MKFNRPFYTILLVTLGLLFSFTSCAQEENTEASDNETFLFGSDVLISKELHLLKGKSIGVLCNQTSVLLNGTHLIDTLITFDDLKLITLFSPEHGIRGDIEAGSEVGDTKDRTGIPVISLYGKKKKPTAVDLKNINLLIYDLQDVGVRFYTYISTLYYLLEAASENKIPVIVLDRPNMINGVTVNGPVLENKYKSFIGIAPIPVRYAMTPGELASFYKDKFFPQLDLRVVEMKGWIRDNFLDDFTEQFISPSPNIKDLETAILYPGTCFLEGTNISEGRGTNAPFRIIGAPFVNSSELRDELNKSDISGISLKAVEFVPFSVPGKVLNPKYLNEKCFGVEINITDREKFKPVEFGIQLIYTLLKLYPDEFKFNSRHFDLLAGSDKLRKQLLAAVPPQEIFISWQSELENFNSSRKYYLLY